jgi:hypothetical protein
MFFWYVFFLQHYYIYIKEIFFRKTNLSSLKCIQRCSVMLITIDCKGDHIHWSEHKGNVSHKDLIALWGQHVCKLKMRQFLVGMITISYKPLLCTASRSFLLTNWLPGIGCSMNCPFKSLTFCVGIIPFGSWLFHGSLAGNILYLWECWGFCDWIRRPCGIWRCVTTLSPHVSPLSAFELVDRFWRNLVLMTPSLWNVTLLIHPLSALVPSFSFWTSWPIVTK